MDVESGNQSAPREATTTMALWQSDVRRIHRVPHWLRQDEQNKGDYDPKVVSFGPYHHGKKDLQHCEKAKHFALRMFVDGSYESIGFFYNKVLDVIEDAKKCYEDGSTNNYSNAAFAEMMLLDACFLICYIGIGTLNTESLGQMYSYLGKFVLSLVNRDIFLMENQIPFQIVMLLVNLRYKEEGEEAVSKFLHRTIWGQYERPHIEEIQRQLRQEYKPLSLFEAFHRVLIGNWNPNKTETQVTKKDEREEEADIQKRYKTFRSANDLKTKGIHFCPTRIKSLNAIRFKSCIPYAELELPTWLVSSTTKVFFLNMIAYELRPDNFIEPIVITYVKFMKSLMDTPADVKELRERRILLTPLGSDKEILKMYSGLNTYGMANTSSFRDVKQKIQEHYDSKAKTWIVQLMYTYFNNPWSIIAWSAGVLLLVMTIIQTYYTVYPRN